MKILLISPYRTGELYVPLGLGYLASYLRGRDHQAVILDCVAEAPKQVEEVNGTKKFGLYDSEIKEKVKAVNPDVIGVTSNFTAFHEEAERVARICKELFPSLPVVMGGAHPSMEDEAVISEPFVDFVVRGEGEVAFLKLLSAIEDGSGFESIAGITYEKNGAVVRNSDCIEIINLDELSMPAYDLMRMDIYLTDQRENLFPFAKRTPVGFMITSRGCPFGCTFCSTTQNWKKYRWISASKVVDEIEFLVKTYGVKEIAFQDDSFLAKKPRVLEICAEIIKRKIKISWTIPPGAQIWIVNKELLKAMKESGLYRICFPIETGNPEMLEYINKPVNLKKAMDMIAASNRLGIWTYGNFIIGFPHETREQIEQTLDYMYNCGFDMSSLYIAQPYAGSQMYDEYEKLGLLPNGKVALGSTVFTTRYNTLNLKAAELNDIRQVAVSQFMSRKVKFYLSWKGFLGSLLPKLSSPDRLVYFMRIVLFVAKNSIRKGRLALFD